MSSYSFLGITEINAHNDVGNAYATAKAKNTIAMVNDYQKQLQSNYAAMEHTSYKNNKQLALRFKYMEDLNSTALSEYQISRLTEFVSFLEN